MVQEFLSTEQLVLGQGDLQEHHAQSLPNTGPRTGMSSCCVRDCYPFQDISHAKRTSIFLIYNFFVSVLFSPVKLNINILLNTEALLASPSPRCLYLCLPPHAWPHSVRYLETEQPPRKVPAQREFTSTSPEPML